MLKIFSYLILLNSREKCHFTAFFSVTEYRKKYKTKLHLSPEWPFSHSIYRRTISQTHEIGLRTHTFVTDDAFRGQ